MLRAIIILPLIFLLYPCVNAQNNLEAIPDNDCYVQDFYPSGEVKARGKYKNNRKDSIWVYYNEQGEVKELILHSSLNKQKLFPLNKDEAETLSFNAYYIDENNTLLNYYKQNNLFADVIEISFSGFDSIPADYAIFHNVSTISLIGSSINGLSMYPKLETLYLNESFADVSFTGGEEWLKRIKYLYLQKAQIEGLTSFKSMPRLQELMVAYSGFDNFPADINSLISLKKLTIGVYTGIGFDLSQIDLSKLPKLKEIEVVNWGKNITGIPKNIQNSKLSKLSIRHPALTDDEKKLLQKFKANR